VKTKTLLFFAVLILAVVVSGFSQTQWHPDLVNFVNTQCAEGEIVSISPNTEEMAQRLTNLQVPGKISVLYAFPVGPNSMRGNDISVIHGPPARAELAAGVKAWVQGYNEQISVGKLGQSSHALTEAAITQIVEIALSGYRQEAIFLFAKKLPDGKFVYGGALIASVELKPVQNALRDTAIVTDEARPVEQNTENRQKEQDRARDIASEFEQIREILDKSPRLREMRDRNKELLRIE
jgi:hypothetical protein